MISDLEPNGKGATVVAIGSLPPPVHGNGIVLEATIRRLRERGEVVVFDISPGGLARGLAYHIKRASNVARAIIGLTIARCRSGTLYHNVDAGMGMIYSLGIVAVARLLNYRCFLHHHTYEYVNKHNHLMDLIVRIGGGDTVHVSLANSMAIAFREQYPGACRSVVMGNARFVVPQATPAIPVCRRLVLGHLSRLGASKGLPDVLRTFDALVENCDAELILAGPPDDDETRSAIEDLIARHPSRVQWLGPVYDARKAEFYEMIDVFLFPSPSEAQPLVVLEALQAGRPTVAFSRGTIEEVLSGSGGVLIDPSEDFATRAIPRLASWSADRKSLIAAGELSRRRFDGLLQQSEEEMRDLTLRLAKLSTEAKGGN